MGWVARCSWWLGLASALAAVALLAGGFLLAGRHLDDLYAVHHITGTWMALAHYLNAGTLYPPLEADGHYAGTRYVPLLFVWIAGLARLTGDYLLAAKLSALLSVALLLACVFAASRRSAGRWLDATALTGLVLAFPQALGALLSPHADALAIAFTLAGLLLLKDDLGRGRALLAALLFVAALATKFSAVAGPAAGLAYLLSRQGLRPALRLVVPLGVLSLAGLLALHFSTEGRFLLNFRSLGSGGMSGASVRLGPARLAVALWQPTTFALVAPVAFLALFLAGRARRFELWHWYLLFALGTTLLIFTSPGTDFNHLLELQVASVLVVAQLLAPVGQGFQPVLPGREGRLDGTPDRLESLSHKRTGRVACVTGATLRALVLLAILWGLFDLSRHAGEPAVSARELADALPPHAQLLTEDASAAVLLDRRPVVLDAFAFRVLAERGLIDDGALAARIDRQELDVLVMLGRLDIEGESLCPRFHFGPRVTAAMRRSYRFERQVGGHFLYVPAR